MNALNNALNLVVIAIVALVVLQVAPGLFDSLPADLRKPQFVVCGIVVTGIASFTTIELFNWTRIK